MAGFSRESAGAVLAGTGTLLLLLMPLGGSSDRMLGVAMSLGGHAWLFGAVAWGWGRRLSRRYRALPLWVGLAVGAAAVEMVQPWYGRSRELADWIFSAAGAGWVCMTWQWRGKRWGRWMGLMVLGLVPVLGYGGLRQAEVRSFPILLDPGSVWSRHGWALNSVRLGADGHATVRVASRRSGKEQGRGEYPGLFRQPAQPDWSGMETLRLKVFWPGEAPAMLAMRIDDREGNPPYAERFQEEFEVVPGWNEIRIPVSQWGQTSGGRPMERRGIRQWGVFLVSAPAFDYFGLGMVQLDPAEEQP